MRTTSLYDLGLTWPARMNVYLVSVIYVIDFVGIDSSQVARCINFDLMHTFRKRSGQKFNFRHQNTKYFHLDRWNDKHSRPSLLGLHSQDSAPVALETWETHRRQRESDRRFALHH